jgi:hypothetical protein
VLIGQLTLLALSVLEDLHGTKGGTAGHELVAPAALMGFTVVDLVGGLFAFTYMLREAPSAS